MKLFSYITYKLSFLLSKVGFTIPGVPIESIKKKTLYKKHFHNGGKNFQLQNYILIKAK